MTDASAVLIDGPWRHHFVSANGARFHVASAEDVAGPDPDAAESAPLVLLLHGFPQMWWAWRHQLPALAAAGYRAVAMDARGSGASDKPPQGYDVPTLARDTAGVIRSLGATDAVVVGHGIGASVAWSMPALQPAVTRAVAAFASPHPLRLHAPVVARALTRTTTARRLGAAQLPWFPERRLTHGDLAQRLLAEWGAPGWPPPDVADVYAMAMRVPFAAHSGMERIRWLVRSTPRLDGRRWMNALRRPVTVPALQVHGRLDRAVPADVARSPVGDPWTFRLVEGAGHFLPEEAPDEVNRVLVDWLATLPEAGDRR